VRARAAEVRRIRVCITLLHAELGDAAPRRLSSSRSRGYRSMNPWEALAATAKGEPAAFLNASRTELMIGVRRTTTHP
jgi:hypothetical protein